ncbi:hypothetical protein ACRAWD_25695, partial [Caulobacter segnis]
VEPAAKPAFSLATEFAELWAVTKILFGKWPVLHMVLASPSPRSAATARARSCRLIAHLRPGPSAQVGLDRRPDRRLPRPGFMYPGRRF